MINIKIIVSMMILLILLSSGCIETTINGKHSGQITAIDKTGILWKTYDVYVKSDISSSQEDLYCVEDSSLIPKLEKLSKERKQVTLLYRNEFIIAPWRCGLSVAGIITGVEE